MPDLKKKWGLGRVFKNSRGFEGEYKDEWTGTLQSIFMEQTREEAVGRMNHVKSFLQLTKFTITIITIVTIITTTT